MPKNKNAVTRYQILDELLRDQYHNYSINDLVEIVCNRLSEIDPDTDGVGIRTIQKDLRYLEMESPFNVDIERYSVVSYDGDKQKNVTKQCLRYAKRGFSIFKKEMTPEEEELLSVAFNMLGQFDGLPKLETLENMRVGLGNTQNKVVSLAKNPLSDSNIFGEIFVAITHRQVLKMTYHRFNDTADIEPINIHPYLLREYNRRWFLLAAAESDNKLLIFALDRIDKVVPQPSQKYVSYTGDINEYFDDIVGVTNFQEEEVMVILFWVNDKSKKYVETKPVHDSQILYKGEKCAHYHSMYPFLTGGAFFQIKCKYNYELVRELCSYGADLIVLSPKVICDKVIKRIEEMNAAYKKVVLHEH